MAPCIHTTIAHEAVDVWVQMKLLTPGVKSGDHPGPGAKVSRVRRQLEKGIADALEQQLAQLPIVAQPQDIQLVWDREDDVVMGAPEEDPGLTLKPQAHPVERAARTRPIPTRVVPHTFDVPVGTHDCVATKGRSPTRPNRTPSTPHNRRKSRLGEVALSSSQNVRNPYRHGNGS